MVTYFYSTHFDFYITGKFVLRDLLSRDAVAGQVSSLNARQAVAGNIAYVQSYDRVPRGRGALYLVEGGVGASNLAVFARSGDGQGILRTLEVYGRF